VTIWDATGGNKLGGALGSNGNIRSNDVTLTNHETGEKVDFPAVVAVSMSQELVTELVGNITVNLMNNLIPNVVAALMDEFEARGLIAKSDAQVEAVASEA
jgi:hypothetical protein